MKKVKKVKEFHFKELQKEEIVNILNSAAPVNIKFLEPLIDRIYKRYPLIDKTDISLIVKTAFEVIRELLVLGNIINFNKFVFDMKLHFSENPLYAVAVRMRLKTPPHIKDDLNG